ncbi:serine/threonine protein kinase [Mariniblastus fucicola]|uniref:Serine/threonine-protein kinase PknH n=1 Tax=Mariniblastus fucicola TaxID=980251 RepID=A0A5B9PHX5_9BACT|nr:serine/threonine-protein kinase [Mariniblastus fucicola]QEG24276.1 Serine/threonine-protein kinase PknH [Mariniblastus fucicola]
MSIGRDFIGPFQLLRLIRSGTSTQVWEALRAGEKERIALKVLLRDYRKDKYEIDQLKHEAMVGKDLNHPNVIKIFGYHEDQGFPLLAMQLSSAKNLKIVLREQPELIAANVGPVIRGCADGLKHLHSKGWVHCDVKPDNFLADDDANIKLIDFSIAVKTQKRKTGLGKLFSRKPKQASGTRSYMAPEQIRREALDFRCDMYGLGCVVFELLAGRTPFSGTSPDDLLNRHLHQTPPSLEAVSDSSREFAAIVRKMMAKDPEDRYQDMSQMLSDLAQTEIYKAGKRPEGYQR